MNERHKSRDLIKTIIQFNDDIEGLDLWLNVYNPEEHSNRENIAVIRSTYVLRKRLQYWNVLLEQIKKILIERSEDPKRWLVGLYKEE